MSTTADRPRKFRDYFAFAGALAVFMLAALVVLGLIALVLWMIFASWKIILGFAIAVTVIAALDKGIRGW